MSQPSHEQIALLIYGSGYLILSALFIAIMTWRADRLFDEFRRAAPEPVLTDIDRPTGAKNRAREIRIAWMRFMHSGRYRAHCSPNLSHRIDGFRRQMNIGLTVLAILGIAIIYRYWALIEPEIL
jgi:hypothetical protein